MAVTSSHDCHHLLRCSFGTESKWLRPPLLLSHGVTQVIDDWIFLFSFAQLTFTSCKRVVNGRSQAAPKFASPARPTLRHDVLLRECCQGCTVLPSYSVVQIAQLYPQRTGHLQIHLAVTKHITGVHHELNFLHQHALIQHRTIDWSGCRIADAYALRG